MAERSRLPNTPIAAPIRDTILRSLLSAVSDENTTFIKERQQELDISHGIRLEILPLDGCPESRFARKRQILWALI